MEFTKQLIEKYNLAPHSYYVASAYPVNWADPTTKENAAKDYDLDIKWSKHIPAGWYGFSLAPCPDSWFSAIDEFLDELVKQNQEFEIHQVKLKYGQCRFYFDKLTEDQQEALSLLEAALEDKFLVY
jgi:hypothetical protein